MKTPVKLFLSYTSADRSLCERLWRDLAAATRTDSAYEFALWSMDDNLLAGDDWNHEIRAALDASAVGLFAVSHAMLNSDYVQDVELRHFVDAGKPLVPVLLTQVNVFADLKGLRPRQVFGWNDSYEAQGSRGRVRNWATALAEELHRVLDDRSGR